ncbi:citramalate synthase [Novipirellula aureliae]|nr:citramalate synthase [Novipirellula aureliae]
MNSKSILIYDTTLRDGSQGEGVSFSLLDKLNIAERLAEIGVDFIEGGYPLSNEKDVAFFKEVRKRDLGETKISAFGMTRRKRLKADQDPGMNALVAAETPCITLVGKTWDYHATEVLGVTLEENLALIGESAEFLAKHAMVIYDAEHFFDGFRANPPYAIETLKAAASAGAKWLSLCDTNGGSLPERVAEVTAIARQELADYDVKFGIHCHNDCELAVANSLAAVDAGATQVQGTINGIGERCGNVDLISVLSNLALKKTGYTVLGGRSLQSLTELSRFVYETANLQWQSSQPFVGQSAFAHKGGMHVHAINKAAKTYEHIDPVSVGNERRILVSELSGRSNIVALATKHHIADDNALMDKVLAEVVRLENRGYQFENAAASFDLLIKRIAGSYTSHFEPIKYRVVAGDRDSHGDGQSVFAEAIIKLKVGDKLWFEAAEGKGPVNALDAALRKALLDVYPSLAKMRLIDYKVRVVDSGAGTAASTRVNIESCDENESWGTIGVSENIIEASWRALVDAVEYKLHKNG